MRNITYYILILLVFISCSSSTPNENDEQEFEVNWDYTEPVLSVTPIDLDTVTTVLPFGYHFGGDRYNPTFEYIVNSPDIVVRTSSGGYIERIFKNDYLNDYEIFIKSSENSAYLIIYDHVKDVTVTTGDVVTAGTILGKVGEGNRTELQINYIAGDNYISYCPFNYGTTDFNTQHEAVDDAICPNWCLSNSAIP